MGSLVSRWSCEPSEWWLKYLQEEMERLWSVDLEYLKSTIQFEVSGDYEIKDFRFWGKEWTISLINLGFYLFQPTSYYTACIPMMNCISPCWQLITDAKQLSNGPDDSCELGKESHRRESWYIPSKAGGLWRIQVRYLFIYKHHTLGGGGYFYVWLNQ